MRLRVHLPVEQAEGDGTFLSSQKGMTAIAVRPDDILGKTAWISAQTCVGMQLRRA